MGSAVSVQFQIVPCSSLYLFSRSIGPLHCTVNINCRVLICCACHFQSNSLFFVYFGFLCLQVSLVSNFCPDTRGQRTYLGSLVQLCCGEGGTLQTNITGVCEECSQYMDHTGFAPFHTVCAFPIYTAQVPGCSSGELSKAGRGFHALPRSKLLKFRFSGTPQRHRLSWACILCPSQVQAAQATRCLASALYQVVCAS